MCLGVVVIPSAGRSVAHRVGLSAVEILGNIFLGDFIAARSLSVVFAGNKPALQEIKRSARSDMAYDAEIVAAHRVRNRVLGFFNLFCQSVFTYCCFLHFGLSLFVKWNPKNHYFIFLFLAFFSFVSANLHHYPAFWAGLILHLILHFSKKPPFLPQNGHFGSFSVPTLFFACLAAFSLPHRPKSADKPACIDLGYHHNTFSPINSKSI